MIECYTIEYVEPELVRKNEIIRKVDTVHSWTNINVVTESHCVFWIGTGLQATYICMCQAHQSSVQLSRTSTLQNPSITIKSVRTDTSLHKMTLTSSLLCVEEQLLIHTTEMSQTHSIQAWSSEKGPGWNGPCQIFSLVLFPSHHQICIFVLAQSSTQIPPDSIPLTYHRL